MSKKIVIIDLKLHENKRAKMHLTWNKNKLDKQVISIFKLL